MHSTVTTLSSRTRQRHPPAVGSQRTSGAGSSMGSGGDEDAGALHRVAGSLPFLDTALEVDHLGPGLHPLVVGIDAGEQLGVRIYAQREDLFNAMHRV